MSTSLLFPLYNVASGIFAPSALNANLKHAKMLAALKP